MLDQQEPGEIIADARLALLGIRGLLVDASNGGTSLTHTDPDQFAFLLALVADHLERGIRAL